MVAQPMVVNGQVLAHRGPRGRLGPDPQPAARPPPPQPGGWQQHDGDHARNPARMRPLPTDRPFTLTAALDAGATPRGLTALTREGALVRPFRGVYLPGELATDADSLIGAVGVLVPEGAALARESA